MDSPAFVNMPARIITFLSVSISHIGISQSKLLQSVDALYLQGSGNVSCSQEAGKLKKYSSFKSKIH